MMKVLLTDPTPPSLLQWIQTMLPNGVALDNVPTFSDEDFAQHAADADVLLSAGRQIDARTLALAPRVRFIQQGGAGYDNIDVAATAAAGIPVAYNPGVNATAVAEHTLMLTLVLLKRFISAEQATRAGRFPTAEFVQAGIGDLADATVGLVGLGHIGRAVAERLATFGARVLYTARHRQDAATEARLGVGYVALREMLAASTIVSLHLPLTDESHHLLGEAELALMPPGALLINTSRGGLIDEQALRRAITSGHLGGAALDVLERESDGGNPFADLPQVVVTPHIAGLSRVAFQRMLQMAIANIVRFLAGEPVQNLVPGTYGSSGSGQ